MISVSYRLEIERKGYDWDTGKLDNTPIALTLLVNGEEEARLPLAELRDALKALEGK